MKLGYYNLLVKTLFKFIILPAISLVFFFKSLRIVIYKKLNRLNDISKEVDMHINSLSCIILPLKQFWKLI